MASRLFDIFEDKTAGGIGSGGASSYVAAAGKMNGGGSHNNERVRPLVASSQQQFPNAVELNQLWLQALNSNSSFSTSNQHVHQQLPIGTSPTMTSQRIAILKQQGQSSVGGGGPAAMAEQEVMPPPGAVKSMSEGANPSQQHPRAKISLLPSIVKPVDRSMMANIHSTAQEMMRKQPNAAAGTGTGLPTIEEMLALQVQHQHQQQGILSATNHGGVSVIHHPSKAQRKERKKHLNRVHAKHCRERQKNEHQKLQEDLLLLQRENHKLRDIVRTNIADEEIAQSIIMECCPNHPLDEINKQLAARGGGGVTISAGTKAVRHDLLLHGSDFALIENLIKSKQSFVITDRKQADNPIVYASEAFYKLTGYDKQQTLGRNCRFLQGVGTNQRALDKIRKSIEGKGKGSSSDASSNLLNYKADGTPFWNQLFIAPLRDKHKNIVNYVSTTVLAVHIPCPSIEWFFSTALAYLSLSL